MDNRPIGVFDSGLGGLTGVRELRKQLPGEDIVYFGDTGRVPYGSRSHETILQYARQDIAPVPYMGVVASAARKAAWATRSRKIGVIGTAATIRSHSYEQLLRRLVPGAEITARSCPLFVPLVENGYVDGSAPERQQVTRLVISQYLEEIRAAGVDTLVLGCTHYPLLAGMIGEYMGPSVTLIDPGRAAADDLGQLLSSKGLRANRAHGTTHFFVSDVPDSFVQTADLFLGEYRGGTAEQICIDKY